MSNIIEIAAGVYIAAIIGFVVLCNRIMAWLHGVPRLSKEQLDRHAMWRLRQIGEGRMDARAACMVIPSEADLLASEAAWRREVEQARREIAAKKEEASLTPPEITPHEHTPTEAHPRIVIELVADPKFKVSPGTVSDAFREVVADYREVLCKLARDRRFSQVIEHFRREELRTHNSVRCAIFVMNALFDGLEGVRVTGQLVGRMTPERGESGETAYRNTFFMQDFDGANRRPLQAFGLMLESAPVQNKADSPDIFFEGGKAVIRPHVHLKEMSVSTLRLTFQDGTELDVSADLEFAGLDEKEFRVAYDAFLKTQAELGGLKGPPPPLNSKFWHERGPR